MNTTTAPRPPKVPLKVVADHDQRPVRVHLVGGYQDGAFVEVRLFCAAHVFGCPLSGQNLPS
jgi:hypothetical protein